MYNHPEAYKIWKFNYFQEKHELDCRKGTLFGEVCALRPTGVTNKKSSTNRWFILFNHWNLRVQQTGEILKNDTTQTKNTIRNCEWPGLCAQILVYLGPFRKNSSKKILSKIIIKRNKNLLEVFLDLGLIIFSSSFRGFDMDATFFVSPETACAAKVWQDAWKRREAKPWEWMKKSGWNKKPKASRYLSRSPLKKIQETISKFHLSRQTTTIPKLVFLLGILGWNSLTCYHHLGSPRLRLLCPESM